jgi:hypothetical protein
MFTNIITLCRIGPKVTAQACLGLTLACSEKLIIVTGDAFTG